MGYIFRSILFQIIDLRQQLSAAAASDDSSASPRKVRFNFVLLLSLGAPIAQRVKRWPTDLNGPGRVPPESMILF